MDGLKLLKNDKVGLENIYSKIRYLFNRTTKNRVNSKDSRLKIIEG